MPDITYTVTEEWSEDTIRDWATFETRETPRLPIESKQIEACRQWVAENPEYPDGTLAFVETAGHLPDVAEMVEGRWHRSGVTVSAVPIDGDVKVIRVLHAPPTIRDHLHAIGFDDEMIADVARTQSSILSGVANVGALRQACREAEGLMGDKYRYASTYWCYFEKMWCSDADLKSLIRRNWDMEMAGEQSTLDYYEQVDGEWVRIPMETIKALENEINAERRSEREAAFLTAQTQRWRVWTQGPDGIRELEGIYDTERDALAAVTRFPPILKAAVEYRGDGQ